MDADKEFRCLLIGKAALRKAENDPAFAEELYKLLNRHLTKAADRKLFGLPSRMALVVDKSKGCEKERG